MVKRNKLPIHEMICATCQLNFHSLCRGEIITKLSTGKRYKIKCICEDPKHQESTYALLDYNEDDLANFELDFTNFHDNREEQTIIVNRNFL